MAGSVKEGSLDTPMSEQIIHGLLSLRVTEGVELTQRQVRVDGVIPNARASCTLAGPLIHFERLVMLLLPSQEISETTVTANETHLRLALVKGSKGRAD